MATKKILIQVILDDKASASNKKLGNALGKTTGKFKEMTAAQEKQYIAEQKSIIQQVQYTNTLKKRALVEANVASAANKNRTQSGLNNAILLESGRLASDLNYGFTAIANNLGQLVTLFGSFAETNGGVIASFKELGKSLWGMGGILIGVQLLIAFGQPLYDFFTGMTEAVKKAAKSTKELKKSFDDLNSSLVIAEEYVEVIKDVNTTEEERENIIKELIKLVPDLKEEDFKYGENLDLVKAKIDQYAISQASRIEMDKLVEDNSELLSKRRKIGIINEIKDEEKKAAAILKYATEYGFAQELVTDKASQARIKTSKFANKSTEDLAKSFKYNSKITIDESDKILEKVRELTDTSFLGGKGDGDGDPDDINKFYEKFIKDLDKFLKEKKKLEDGFYESKLTEEDVELLEAEERYIKIIEIAKALGFDTKLLEDARNAEILGIQTKYDDIEKEKEEKKQLQLQKIRDKYQLGKLKVEEDIVSDPETLDELAVFEEKELAKVAKQEELSLAELDKLILTTEEKELAVTDIEAYYAAVRLKNEEDNAKAKKKIGDLEKKSKLEQLDAIGKGLMSASKIAGESTGVGKALAIAGTTMSTYAAAQQAYQSQMTLTPDAPIRAEIARASAILGGLANVKAIMAVKTPAMKEGSSVSGIGSAATTVQAPDFNVVGQGAGSQLAGAVSNQFGGALRAYVVSGDISSAQELDRKINTTATIG